MSQSLTKLSTHIVFRHKYRQPLGDAAIEPELYAYLDDVCNIMECLPVKVSGYTDHIHILVMRYVEKQHEHYQKDIPG